MSRRRSSNPTKAISITVPQNLLDRLDETLTLSQSRSLWITGAMRMRLDETNEIMEISTRQLIAMLHARDISEQLKAVLLSEIGNH